MKRFIPGIAILLILSLTACSAPKTPPKDTGDASNSQSEGIIMGTAISSAMTA